LDLQLIGILAALFFSAWFAGSETSFLSYNRARLQAWLRSGRKGTRAVDFLSRKPERFLITTLTGNNLSTVIYSSLMALWLTRYGFSERFILVVAPLILLVFGETIPKVIARQSANQIILVVGVVLYVFRLSAWPFIRLIETVLVRMGRYVGLPEKTTGHVLSRTEIVNEIKTAGREGDYPENTYRILHRFFKISERRVRDIMTPRTSVVALSVDAPASEARRLIIESGFTRLPCYRKQLDDVIGVVTAQDLLKKPPDLKTVIRPLLSVPALLTVVELVSWMKKNRTSLAGVLDEHGGMAGIVTVDDIARELVGMIEDEYDTEDHQCIRLSNSTWLVDGRTRLSILGQRLGFDLFREEAASLGGAVIRLFNRIPKVGDELDLPAATIRVIQASPRGVGLVRITVRDRPDNDNRLDSN